MVSAADVVAGADVVVGADEAAAVVVEDGRVVVDGNPDSVVGLGCVAWPVASVLRVVVVGVVSDGV